MSRYRAPVDPSVRAHAECGSRTPIELSFASTLAFTEAEAVKTACELLEATASIDKQLVVSAMAELADRLITKGK